LKDQDRIHKKKTTTNTQLTELQRTILQQYNEQQQSEQLKDRNKFFHGINKYKNSKEVSI